MDGISFGAAGVGSSTLGRYLSIEGNADSSGEGSARIFFTEHNSTTAAMSKYGMSLGYRGGSTSIVGSDGNTWTGLTAIGNGEWGLWGHNNSAAGTLAMWGPRDGTYVQAPGSFRAPIFYDSDSTTYYANPASRSNFGSLDLNSSAVWDATTQGTSKGALHLDPNSATDHAGGAITFGASDTSNGTTAQAGIYVRSDGSYGTRMYFATTDNYTTGSKTAMHILQNGQVNITRSNLLVNTDVRAPLFYDSNNTGRYVDPSSTSRINRLEIENQSNQTTPTAYMQIGSDSFIFGGNNSGYETNSAQISAGMHTANSLNFVGMGTTSSVRRMDFWAEGGFYVSGNIYDKDATSYYADFGGTSRTNSIISNVFSGDISTSGDGQNNYPFRLRYDYNAWMMTVASNTWGLFWAGNSGAR